MSGSEADDPLLVARKKNKIAQQKYRDRQKSKKLDLTHQIAVLEKKIARLETVHQKLETQNHSLEGLALEVKQKYGKSAVESVDLRQVGLTKVIIFWLHFAAVFKCLATYVFRSKRTSWSRSTFYEKLC